MSTTTRLDRPRQLNVAMHEWVARAVRPGPLFSLCALKQKTARHRNWDEISSQVFSYIHDFFTILVYLFKNVSFDNASKRYIFQKGFHPTVTRISCYVRWQRHHSWKWYLCPVAVSNLKQKILGLLLLVLSLIHWRLEWIFENKIGGTHFTADLLSSFLIYFRMYLQERSEKSYRKQFNATSKDKSIPEVMKSSKTLIFLTQTLTQNFVVLFDEFWWEIFSSFSVKVCIEIFVTLFQA